MTMGLRSLLVGAAAVALAVACKDDKQTLDSSKADKQAPVETALSPLEPKPLGFAAPKNLGYRWGKARKSFELATELLKKEKRDYAKIAETAALAVAADPGHLEAQRLLGIALLETGKKAEGLDHLSTAVAADWLRWGPELTSDGPLQDLFATEDGKLLSDLNETYRSQFFEQAAKGIMVVAKRTQWKRPTKIGSRAWAATRAELFVYTEDERYLRLTHSGEAVAGFVESADGGRLALLLSTDVVVGEAEVMLHRPAVQVIDAKTFAPIGKRARASGGVTSVQLSFDEAGELVAILDQTAYTVDAMAGKLRKKGPGRVLSDDDVDPFAVSAPTLIATAAKVRVYRPASGVGKGAAPNQFKVMATKTSVSLPAAGGSKLLAVGLSPNGRWVAFVGTGDEAAEAAAPALYVADTKDGKPVFVHRGTGTHAFRWLSEDRLLFEASPRELNIYDAASAGPCCSEVISSRYELGLATASNEQAQAVRPGTRPPLPAAGSPADPAGPPKAPAPADVGGAKDTKPEPIE